MLSELPYLIFLFDKQFFNVFFYCLNDNIFSSNCFVSAGHVNHWLAYCHNDVKRRLSLNWAGWVCCWPRAPLRSLEFWVLICLGDGTRGEWGGGSGNRNYRPSADVSALLCHFPTACPHHSGISRQMLSACKCLLIISESHNKILYSFIGYIV